MPCAYAQEGNNWVTGWHSGLDFATDPPTHFKTSICNSVTKNPATAAGGAASISDCRGNLLFYTNSNDIWNRYDSLMPNGLNVNNFFGGSFGDNATIIPYPGQDSTYLIFSMNSSRTIAVNKIKMQLDSGRGDVDTTYQIHFFSKGTIFKSSEFKYVKQSDSLYWIINIVSNGNGNAIDIDSLLYCYKVDMNGIDTVPVITQLNNGMHSYYIDLSNKGDKLALYDHVDQNLSYKPFQSVVAIYDFDNKTGKASNRVDALLNKYIYGSTPLNGVFSPNDSFLYVSCDYNYGVPKASRNSRIIQIPLYPLVQNKFYNVIVSTEQRLGNLRLTPNNKVIIWKLDTSKIISSPNKAGKYCGYAPNYICNDVANYDSYYPPSIYSPMIKIDYTTNTDTLGCVNDSVRFYNNSDTGFLSFRWYFGDGDSLDAKDAVHYYKQTGKYLVTLSGLKNNCGYRLVRSDSIDVHYMPKINIIKKDIYTCGAYKMQTTLQWKFADNIMLHWGDGTDTLLYTTNKNTFDSILLYHNYSTGNYIVSARAWNNTCQDSTAITNKVNIHPKPYAYFTPDYLQSCGNSTITLTDSSGGMDSIIQQRKWTISYPNNIIKQYDTVTANKLKLIVQDTGYYNAKLIYITKQGCIDSLYKTKVFRILPQPVVYIDSPARNPLCFKDSFILTAKQKDTAYPPLVKYKWNAGLVNTPSITVDTANSYYVSATNAFGCGAQSNTVKIGFLPQLFASIKRATDSLYIIASRKIVSYTWYKDNVLYDSTSSLFHPPSGRYYVHVVDANGCAATSGSLLHIGMDNIEDEDNGIRVYPNPVSDVLYVEWSSALVGYGSTSLTTTNQRQGLPSTKTNIVMYDMMGRNILQVVVVPTNHARLIQTIYVGALPKGLYILSVGGDSDSYRKVKVVVE